MRHRLQRRLRATFAGHSIVRTTTTGAGATEYPAMLDARRNHRTTSFRPRALRLFSGKRLLKRGRAVLSRRYEQNAKSLHTLMLVRTGSSSLRKLIEVVAK